VTANNCDPPLRFDRAAFSAAKNDVVRGASAVPCRFGDAVATFSYAIVPFPSPEDPDLLCNPFDVRHVSSPDAVSARATHVASDGLIWPKDGSASIAWAATAAVRLSSPGLRPFLARQESLTPPSSAALRPEDGCVVDRLRPADRHRGRGGRGLENSKEK
jgi:hypothetical protein